MKKKLTSRSAPTAAARAGHTPPITAAATTGTTYSSATLASDSAVRLGASSAVRPARPAPAAARPNQLRRAGTAGRDVMIPLYAHRSAVDRFGSGTACPVAGGR